VVFEKSSKGLILVGIVSEDHMPTIVTKNVFNEIGNFVIVLLHIRIILCADINTLTSGLIAIMYLSQ
jgi:hypothetical protein